MRPTRFSMAPVPRHLAHFRWWASVIPQLCVIYSIQTLIVLTAWVWEAASGVSWRRLQCEGFVVPLPRMRQLMRGDCDGIPASCAESP